MNARFRLSAFALPIDDRKRYPQGPYTHCQLLHHKKGKYEIAFNRRTVKTASKVDKDNARFARSVATDVYCDITSSLLRESSSILNANCSCVWVNSAVQNAGPVRHFPKQKCNVNGDQNPAGHFVWCCATKGRLLASTLTFLGLDPL